jgi:hypothetical protein
VSQGTPEPGGARPRSAPGTGVPTPRAGRHARSPPRRASSPFRRAGTGPSRRATPTAADSPHSAPSAASPDPTSGRRSRMVVAHEAGKGCTPGTAQTGPRGWRNEGGPRSKRKDRVIGRTPGSPGRSSSLSLVRPGLVLCAGISRSFHPHVLTRRRLRAGASVSDLASGKGRAIGGSTNVMPVWKSTADTGIVLPCSPTRSNGPGQIRRCGIGSPGTRT